MVGQRRESLDLEELRNSPHYARGRAQADADIADGRLGQRSLGRLPPRWREVAEILKQQYQIHCRPIGAGSMFPGTLPETLGYIERMREESMEQHGSDVIANTWRNVEGEMGVIGKPSNR